MRGASLALLLALAGVATAQAPHIRVEATDAYVVSRPGEKASGPALDFAEAVLARAGLDYTVEVAPWARAYSIATSQADVLVFTLGRTPEREQRFEWIGPTFPLRFQAYRLKQRQDIVIRSPGDLRKYRISVVRDAAIVPFLLRLNLPDNRIDIGLQYIATARDHWAKLERDRVDLFIATSLAVDTMCLRGDLDCERIATAWSFSEPTVTAYLAFSAGTAPATVAKAIAAYRALRADGSYERMLRSLDESRR